MNSCDNIFSYYNKQITCKNFLQDRYALASFVAAGASLAAYPIDTVRSRMMMRSGEAVKYRSSLDAFAQILMKEGVRSLFKGAEVNLIRSIAGAACLTLFDGIQADLFGEECGGGSENDPNANSDLSPIDDEFGGVDDSFRSQSYRDG